MPVYPTCRPGCTFLYVLRDPRDEAVRYVGKTSCPGTRFYHHLSRGKEFPARAEWFRDLGASGLRPELVIIEEVGLSEWQERERFWIRHYREAGAALFNVHDGGQYVPEGYQLSELTRARISEAQRGKPHTPEHRKHISEATKGRTCSEKTRQAVAAAHRGKVASADSRRKMSESQSARHEHTKVAMPCAHCGATVYRRLWQLKQTKYGKAFCNNFHASQWLAEQPGFLEAQRLQALARAAEKAKQPTLPGIGIHEDAE